MSSHMQINDAEACISAPLREILLGFYETGQ